MFSFFLCKAVSWEMWSPIGGSEQPLAHARDHVPHRREDDGWAADLQQFLDILKEEHLEKSNDAPVIARVLHLFNGHRELILGFNSFLSPGYKIEYDGNSPTVTMERWWRLGAAEDNGAAN